MLVIEGDAERMGRLAVDEDGVAEAAPGQYGFLGVLL